MTDIVNIGFQVDTRDIATGQQRMDKFVRGSERAEKRIDKSVVGMSRSFTDLSGSVGLVTTAIAGLVASSGIGAAISANREFEKSVSGLSAITGAAGEDLEFYKQQAAEVGSTTTLSASQAVNAFKLIASAKPDLLASKESLAEVTKEAVALAEATGGELGLEGAAMALGGALNQFQLDASKSSDVINILAASAQQGTASIAKITEAMVNTGAAANALDVSFVETVSGLQALAKNNILGADAGTALNQVLLRLERSADRELMPSVVGLSQAIETLSERNMSTTELMKFFGDEAFKAGAAIIAQKDTLSGLIETLVGTSTAYDQAATQTDNLDGDLKSLASVVESLSISVGDEFDPALRSAAQALTEILSNSEALGASIKTAAGVIALGATPAVAAYTASLFANVKAQLLANTQAVRTVSALGQVTVAAGSATVATNALAMASRFLLGPWGLLLTAVSAAGIAYAASASAAEKQNDQLERQLGLTKDLTKNIEKLSEFQRAGVALQSQLELNDLKKEQAKIESELLAQSFDANQPASLTLKTNERLTKVKERILELEDLIRAAQDKGTEKRDSGGGTDDELTSAANDQIDALKTLQKELSMTDDKLFVFREVQKSIARNDAPAVTEQIREQAKAYLEAKNAQKDLFATDTVDLSALNQAKEYDEWVESISTTSTQIAALRAEIQKTQSAITAGDLQADIGAEHIENLRSQINSLEVNPFKEMTDGASDALQAMSGMFESGSKDAKKLAIAMQALNLVQGVNAILTQGQGDPITAWGRMASMASLVASLGVSINSLSGDFADESAQNQANQSLNSWGEKSDSISQATEETAAATKKLVGINTDMLKALQNLTMSISAAAGVIIKGSDAPNIDIGELGLASGLFDAIGLGFIDDFISDIPLLGGIFGGISSLFGGKSKVTDEGIRVIGGALTDLLDDVTVEAFQSIKYKRSFISRSKRKTKFKELGDDVSNQFSLVFESIVDSVVTGADILGFSSSEINSALESFRIATETISLKDLSAEEQKAEIEAYFSSVFNDLAGHVIPFVDDFQKVGEELGETLARLATEVSVAEHLMQTFGITFADKFVDQEAFISAADNLAMLAGGVEELAGQISSFTDAFATDAQKLEIHENALTEALGAVGLALPSTSEGLYDLLASMDATTEAGQEQIATILGLTDTAAAYYSLQEAAEDDRMKAAEEQARAAERLRSTATSLYDVTNDVRTASLDAALTAARFGDFSLADDLNLGSIGPDKSDFSSLVEYNLARAETASKLNELADLQDGSIGISEKQLTVLEQIRDNMINGGKMGGNDELTQREMAGMRSEFRKNQEATNQYLRQMVYGGINVRLES